MLHLTTRPNIKLKTLNAIYSKQRNATYQLLPKHASYKVKFDKVEATAMKNFGSEFMIYYLR